MTRHERGATWPKLGGKKPNAVAEVAGQTAHRTGQTGGDHHGRPGTVTFPDDKTYNITLTNGGCTIDYGGGNLWPKTGACP